MISRRQKGKTILGFWAVWLLAFRCSTCYLVMPSRAAAISAGLVDAGLLSVLAGPTWPGRFVAQRRLLPPETPAWVKRSPSNVNPESCGKGMMAEQSEFMPARSR